MAKNIISDKTIIAVKSVPFTAVLEKENISFKKTGKEALTICPWHNDKNPSLTINDEKGFCYCFVCQTGKDSIGFVEQKIGCTFSEAICRIANNHGIEIVYENIDPIQALAEAKKRNEHFESLKRMQEEFRSNLRDPRAFRIRDIIDSRSIQPSTSRYFGLGYSLNGFFADRITIPIHDHLGSLIGFTGRSTKDEVKPKYKNTENSQYFDKSKLVFNEHRSSPEIKSADAVVFVEGHFDVITLWQHGIKNVVAMQGTAAPSIETIYRLSKKTKRFILCYDGDQGGTKAVEQFIKAASPLASKGDINIFVSILPEGTDPDQCCREGLVDMSSVLENSIPWIDWLLSQWVKNIDKSNVSAIVEIENKLKSLVGSLQSTALRQYYIDKTSLILAENEISASIIARSWARELPTINTQRVWVKPSKSNAKNNVEKRLLRTYLHYPDSREEIKPLMDNIQTPSYAWLWSRIKECEHLSKGSDLCAVIKCVLIVSEPSYMRQLRPILMPSINLKLNTGILKHTQEMMRESSSVSTEAP